MLMFAFFLGDAFDLALLGLERVTDHVRLVGEVGHIPVDDLVLVGEREEGVAADAVEHERHELLDGLDVRKALEVLVEEDVRVEGLVEEVARHALLVVDGKVPELAGARHLLHVHEAVERRYAATLLQLGLVVVRPQGRLDKRRHVCRCRFSGSVGSKAS